MPRKTAARDSRRTKSAPQAPTVKQYRAQEQRQGELIALQRETLTQLANALERIAILEAAGPRQKDERLRFVASAFRLEFQKPRPGDIERVRHAVFGDTGMRWLRRLRLIPQAKA